MKTKDFTAREEWVCLGVSIGFGIAALAIAAFVPFDTGSTFILAPLVSSFCGILALAFLGLHMSSRVRRKTAERKRAKEVMTEILDSVR
jgi:hypothetical protein